MHVRDATSLIRLTLLCSYFAWVALGLHAPGRAVAQAVDGGEPQAQPQRVLFLMPELEPAARAQLQDALFAQLSLVDAELVLRDDKPGAQSEPAQARVQSAQARAESERARIVLWLDLEDDGRWLVHVMDVGQERMVVRRIDARWPQQAAATEQLAVLTREASRAGPLLLDAETEPDVPDPAAAIPEPEPATAAPARAPEPAPAQVEVDSQPPRLRLALFYTGANFAPETAFSHGVGLGARLDWQGGLFVGVHAGWTALAKPRRGALAVQRIPLGAGLGYRGRLVDRFWTDFELGVLVDLLQRESRGPVSSSNKPGSSLRIAVALAPRLRAEYRPTELMGVFMGFGLDIALTFLRYDTSDTPAKTVLSPNFVRPALEAGIAFYP